MLVDRTDHNRIAAQHAARIADKYIPAVNRTVAPTDNLPDDDSVVALDPDRQLGQARDATAELNGFLKANPVIETAMQAKAAGGAKERTRIALAQLDVERVGKVDPLNKQVKAINATYKAVREPLETLRDQLDQRLDQFRVAEEARREAAAAAIRREAEAAARAAQAAAAQVSEAIDDAAVGAETDLGALVEDAQAAANAAARLDRLATIATRDSKVRIVSDMSGRAISARTHTDYIIADVEAACMAIRAMGLTDGITDAIRIAAKAFKQAWGELPPGVIEHKQRSI